MDELQNSKILETIKAQLSSHLGLDPDDIDPDDSFQEELHMRPPEFSDFLDGLQTSGFETNDLDLTEIKTVRDLVEALSSHEYVE